MQPTGHDDRTVEPCQRFCPGVIGGQIVKVRDNQDAATPLDESVANTVLELPPLGSASGGPG
jgi:hypothetical protein